MVGSGDGNAKSLSPYKDVGLRLSAVVDDSGEFGTVVWFVVTERTEFSDDTDEPVEFGLILSRVLERRRRTDDDV